MTGFGPAAGVSQRLVEVASSDSSGNATFTFPAAGSGVVVTGTLVVPAAPLSAHFVIDNGGGTQLGSFDGYNPWGAVQVMPSERLTVTATGLAKSTVYQCVWTCYQTDLAHAPVPPTPYGGVTNINTSTINPIFIELPPPPGTIAYTNTITIASTGVAQQLGNFALTFGLTMQALSTNAAKMNIGGSSVSTTSYTLEAGASVTFPIDNPDIIWILGTAGDKLSVWGA